MLEDIISYSIEEDQTKYVLINLVISLQIGNVTRLFNGNVTFLQKFIGLNSKILLFLVQSAKLKFKNR